MGCLEAVPGLRVAELRRTAVSYLLSHHLAHPHHLVPVSLAIMASPSKSAHVVTSPVSPDVVTPKKRRRAATLESPSVLSPALSVVTLSSSASPASRSRLSRSPGSPRLRQTNINLRSLYTAYSKEERVREIAFLRATSEDITDVGPRALEEAARSLSNFLISAAKGNGWFARLFLNKVECAL